jgi:hypothetical protein
MRSVKLPSRPREENPVIFLEISTTSDNDLRPSAQPGLVLGRLYFELRQDIVPLACHNFLQLVRGSISTNGDLDEVRNVHIYTYMCIHTYMCMYIHIKIYEYICIYIYKYI